MTDGQTDRRTKDKVIPMCRYASQATQKCRCVATLSVKITLNVKIFTLRVND